MDSVAYRFAEVSLEKRADGEEVISGVVVPYGTVADLGFFRERMLPGSIRFDDVIANLMHVRSKPIARTGSGLELVNGPTELRAIIHPAKVRDGQEALELVRSKVLRGMSAEFAVDRNGERQSPDGIREITSAKLIGLAVVDRPAYPDALATIAKRYAPASTVRRWIL